MGSKFFGLNFEVGVVFSERKCILWKQKSIIFLKSSPAVVNYLVISLLGSEAPISYNFHLDQADIVLLGMRILVHIFGKI